MRAWYAQPSLADRPYDERKWQNFVEFLQPPARVFFTKDAVTYRPTRLVRIQIVVHRMDVHHVLLEILVRIMVADVFLAHVTTNHEFFHLVAASTRWILICFLPAVAFSAEGGQFDAIRAKEEYVLFFRMHNGFHMKQTTDHVDALKFGVRTLIENGFLPCFLGGFLALVFGFVVLPHDGAHNVGGDVAFFGIGLGYPARTVQHHAFHVDADVF